MSSLTWQHAKPGTPCPVCGSEKPGGAVFCSFAQGMRGILARCANTSSDSPPHGWEFLQSDKTGTPIFCEKRNGQPGGNGNGQHRPAAKSGLPVSAPRPPADVASLHAALVKACADEHRAALAAKLGVPVTALDVLPVGWTGEGWAMPECDAGGQIVGLNVRFPDGSKKVMPGHHRGLTLPDGWQSRPAPVYIVEGASDVLAGRLLGLNVIGRPSNTGGADLLAVALEGRAVIVCGENDKKPDGKWPGREGAEAIAAKLQASWKRPIHVAYPPEGAKDLRAWLVQHAAGDFSPNKLAELREQWTESTRPPAIILFVTGPADGRGRIHVKAYNRAGQVAFEDRIDPASARARETFAKAVKQREPLSDPVSLADELMRLEPPVADVADVADVKDGLPEGPAVRPGGFILPTVAGTLVQRQTLRPDKNGEPKPAVVHEYLLIHADGKRERVPFSHILHDCRGGNVYPDGEPPNVSARTIANGWTRGSQVKWLEGCTPSLESVRDRLAEVIAARVWLPPENEDAQALLLACYVVLTYVSDALQAAPYLHVTGPKGSGKSQGTLGLIADFGYRPISTSNASAAVLYRTLHGLGGTMLLDETESLHAKGERTTDLLGVLNCGYSKGFPARRCEGEDLTPREFDVYGCKVLASIGNLPDTLSSRCIKFPMLRKPKEATLPVSTVNVSELRDDLHSLIFAHVLTLREKLSTAPDYGLCNRSADLWRPLLTIAEWLDPSGNLQLVNTLRHYADAAVSDAEQELSVPDADAALLRALWLKVKNGQGSETTAGDAMKDAKLLGGESLFADWKPRRAAAVLRRYGCVPTKRRMNDGKVRASYADVTGERLQRTAQSYGLDLEDTGANNENA